MFDVTKIFNEVPLTHRAYAERRLDSMRKPDNLSHNRQQLRRELNELEYRLNMLAWGHWVTGLPAPTSEERETLLKANPSIEREAAEAVIVRYILGELDAIDREERTRRDEADRRADAARAEKDDREAFDAFEADEREKRFREWRRRRRG